MAWFTLLPVTTNGFDGSEISKIRWPIHSNKVERVSQPCSNENYRRLSQRHVFRTLCLCLLHSAKNCRQQWVAICP